MNELLNNLIPMACIYGAYALTYFANMVLGVANNCLVNGDKFDFTRILKSFLKLIVVAVVTACVVAGFELIQNGAEMYGLDITDSVMNVVSIASFLGLFAGGFGQVVKDVYDKIKAIFEIGTAGKAEDIQNVIEDIGGIG